MEVNGRIHYEKGEQNLTKNPTNYYMFQNSKSHTWPGFPFQKNS